MPLYNFDEMVQRSNTNSIKYDFWEERGKPADVLPLWVADMDFKTVPEVIERLKRKADHGIYGYSDPKSEYYETMIGWMRKQHDWETRREWYCHTPGVIFAIGLAIRALTKENDAVMIQKPVYYPFSSIIKNNNRILVNNPLTYQKDENGNGSYVCDIADFENKIIENHVKMFLLCSPHNPVGRVWTREELTCIGDICQKHGVIVVSDEIHQDFVYEGHKHLVFAKVKPEYADFTITCTSPSKTFNLAGLQVSNIIIPNQTYKRAIIKEMDKTGYDNMSLFGLIAAQTAYATGETWLLELKNYLAGNLKFTRDFLRTRLPQISLVEPEGTYLIWLDCSKLGYGDETLNHLILNKAKLWLDAGSIFGREGEGFERINIATSRFVLEKALLALENAVTNPGEW